MKVRAKKCLVCFEHIPEGSKSCPSCGVVFKSTKRKKTWIDKLKAFLERAGRKRIGKQKQ